MIGGLRLRPIRPATTTPSLSTPRRFLCAWDRPRRKRHSRCASCARGPTTRRAINAHQPIARSFRLTIRFSMPPLLRPVRLRCFREALRWQNGMRRPAGLHHARKLPGGSGNPPSATTSGREELADGEAFSLHPARDRANNRRGGAPRGERSRWNARRPLTPAGHHYWPAEGCRCTRAPVGAPLPHGV